MAEDCVFGVLVFCGLVLREDKMRTIQYAIDTETRMVISRVDSELAWPVLDYDNMRPENNYTMNYYLEKITVFSVAGRVWNGLKWTRKIPRGIKNLHRQFWGMRRLK